MDSVGEEDRVERKTINPSKLKHDLKHIRQPEDMGSIGLPSCILKSLTHETSHGEYEVCNKHVWAMTEGGVKERLRKSTM